MSGPATAGGGDRGGRYRRCRSSSSLSSPSACSGGKRAEPEPPPPPVLTAANAFLDCTDCHSDLDRMFTAGEKPDLLFTHEAHFGIGVSDCAACHVANTHEPDRTNRPTMVTCYQCHTLEEDARAPGDCALCHPPEMNPEPTTHFTDAWLPQEHWRSCIEPVRLRDVPPAAVLSATGSSCRTPRGSPDSRTPSSSTTTRRCATAATAAAARRTGRVRLVSPPRGPKDST